tara:strand:- start:1970 stop:2149 length:180 start_codon:yes stop_codon:yes gene_type:complete
MGKMKQKLEEDMMLYPESYSQDDSDYMTEAELRSQMNEAKTFIKEHFTVCIIPDKKEKE